MGCSQAVGVLAMSCWYAWFAAAIPIPVKSGIYVECGETNLDVTNVVVIKANLAQSALLSYDGIRLVCKDDVRVTFLPVNSTELVASVRYPSPGDNNSTTNNNNSTDTNSTNTNNNSSNSNNNSTECEFDKIDPSGNQSAVTYEAKIEFYIGDVISELLGFTCPEPRQAVADPALTDPVVVTPGLMVDCSSRLDGPSILTVSKELVAQYTFMDVQCRGGGVFIPEKTVSGNYVLEIVYAGDNATSCVFDKLPSSMTYTVEMVFFMNPFQYNSYLVTCTYNPPSTPSSTTSGSTESATPPLPSIIPLEGINQTTTTVPNWSPATSGGALSLPTVDYILDVAPRCAADPVGHGSIAITTDLLALQATVLCMSGERYPFWTQDGVHYEVHVYYAEQVLKTCVFDKRVDADIYNVHVVISWGEKGSMIHTVEKRFQVTCTYDDKQHLISGGYNVGDGMVAPKEIQQHMGFPANTVAVLYLADVLGRTLETNRIYLGRTVRLVATTNGDDGEMGIKPVACDAVGVNTGERYAILRGGCGDGIVFSKSEGFVTDGLLARSPYFRAFHMSGDKNIKFECNITLCPFPCDSSSCATERKIRSASYVPFLLNWQMNDIVIKTTDDVSIRRRYNTSASFLAELEKFRNCEKFKEMLDEIRPIYVAVVCVGMIVVVIIANVYTRLIKNRAAVYAL